MNRKTDTDLQRLFREDDRLRADHTAWEWRQRQQPQRTGLVTKRYDVSNATEDEDEGLVRFRAWFERTRDAPADAVPTLDQQTQKRWDDWVDARIDQAITQRLNDYTEQVLLGLFFDKLEKDISEGLDAWAAGLRREWREELRAEVAKLDSIAPDDTKEAIRAKLARAAERLAAYTREARARTHDDD